MSNSQSKTPEEKKVSWRDLQDQIEKDHRFLKDIATTIHNPILREYAQKVLETPGFKEAWGSSSEDKHHHSYQGGLVTHTAEVLRYSIFASQGYKGFVDKDVLIAAAITHDAGKILDYTIEGKKTQFYKKVRHLVFAPMDFATFLGDKFGDGDLSEEQWMNFIHALLAHHGRKEWGSPVEPQTLEALILHNADMVSSRFGETSKWTLQEDNRTVLPG